MLLSAAEPECSLSTSIKFPSFHTAPASLCTTMGFLRSNLPRFVFFCTFSCFLALTVVVKLVFSLSGLPSPFAAPRRAPPSVYASLVPAIVPTKRLPVTFTSSRHSFRNGSNLRTSENNLSEACSMLNTDLTETKQHNGEREVFL